MTGKPTVTEESGGYKLRWTEGIEIDVTMVRQHSSDGRVTGDLAVRFGANGSAEHLHQAQFNFNSTVARDKLTKTLASRVDEVDWYAILEQTCFQIVGRVRRGEPVVELWGEAEAKRPEYLINPLTIKGYPNVLFGDPGSFKSALAVVFSAIVTLPWIDNPLQLPPPGTPTPCLYLDWETDNSTVNWTFARIRKGHGLTGFPIHHRFCSVPLAQDIDALQRIVSDCEAQMVIIDSLTMAAGGDLKEPAPATQFFGALRQMKCTSLILAHNAKDDGQQKKTRSVFGSQVFTAQARNIWEAKKVQDVGEDEIDLGLFHRKAPPFAKFSPAIGMHVTFTEDSMTVRAQEAKTVREFVADLGMKAQIREALQGGALSVDDIATTIEGNPSSVRRVLYRMKDKHQVCQVEGSKWGLALNEE